MGIQNCVHLINYIYLLIFSFSAISIYAAFFFGDPHFETLDGLMYTFNGWGEYIIYKLVAGDEIDFAVQARTQPVNESDPTSGTIMVAISAGILNTSVVEVSCKNNVRQVNSAWNYK